MWRTGRLAGTLLCAAVVFAAGTVQLPEGSAKKTVEAACGSCHALDIVTGKQWSHEKWQDVVQAMVERGAALKKDETADVVSYLAKNFGQRDRGRELVRDICSFCHGVSHLRNQRRTRDEWDNLINGMISEGAPVTDEEYTLILDYLAKNFGPPEEQR